MKYIQSAHGLWVIMMLLTLTTYAIAKTGFSGTAVMMFLLLTAIIKGSIIISDFMEVRGVSLLWRIIMHGWLWSIGLTIAVTYIIGGST